ncbi:DNA methyltransferase [Ruegeria sp. 2205SS24-7]|uniref:site-specific DNA-methyltransferase n=1 Tax=Ruegeria discodermiae TaxID=3064389 RepID=UPI002740DDEE|nr:DNA methyltransferase [Ruegeria sp. 2205SS24-7]MDP5220404.1 DNA methyltransferase [Ruegeria sp. 2205SS24-7]
MNFLANPGISERSKVEFVEVGALEPYANNPRTHSKKQIMQIRASFLQFGWTNPILIDENNRVIAGHGRLAAAKELGLTVVPVLRIEHMSDAEKRAYIIADNKLAENADWDTDLLKIELQGLADLDVDFDLELTGFETGEIDIILSGDTDPDAGDPVPLPDLKREPVSREGDLWFIGPHRIICGNALDPETWPLLMGRDRAQMVFTDPPYNVPIYGHVSGLGRVRHREFEMASGEMSLAEFTKFLSTTFRNLADYSENGSIHYICMDWRHMREVLDAADGVYRELKNLCVWAKTNAGMGTFYRSQHELVFAFRNGTAAHINNFRLGETGRHRSNLWTYAGANTFREGRMEDLAAHPTVKPIEMVADAIMDCSRRGGVIADAFAGSGTTLLAAARTGRVGVGIELDPQYVDLIVRRLQAETGETALHGDSFDDFKTIAQTRGAAA